MDVGYIDWFEFKPMNDTFVVRVLPDETKKTTEQGLILAVEESVVQDRPSRGEIVSVGAQSRFQKGNFVYWEPQKGLDLEMIRKEGNESYLLLYDDGVLGIKVKDVRERG